MTIKEFKVHMKKRAGIFAAVPVIVHKDFGIVWASLTAAAVIMLVFGPLLTSIALTIWVSTWFCLTFLLSGLWTLICWIPEKPETKDDD